MYKNIPKKRYDKTLKMLKDICQPGSVIYDLGVENPFSKIMQENNYKVYNSEGQDFDIDFKINIPKDVDLVTGFEILEHLVSPFPLLKSLEAKKLFVTVPLNLWFSKAYRSKIDNRDRHFHEFEEWQFDWLLEKAGWKILTQRWIGFFIALAVLNEIVWRTQSTDIWVNFKVFGILPITFIFTMTQFPLIKKYQIED